MSLNKFIEGWNDYVSTESDDPDDIKCYRAFSGLRRAWGDSFYQNYNYICHKAACLCASFSTHEERYNAALNVLKGYAEDAKYSIEIAKKNAPRLNYYYECDLEPQPPTEEDARNLFVDSFRDEFPRKRINSKFANEQWIEKRDKAMEICRQRYEREHEKWKKRREKYQEAQRKLDQERADFIAKQNELIEIVENILRGQRHE